MKSKCGKYNSRKLENRVSAALLLIAFAAAAAVLFLVQRENTAVKVEALDSFVQGDPSAVLHNVEKFEEGEDGSIIVVGWCLKPRMVYPFYNYGTDEDRAAVYNNMRVGYTDGTNVYILPTKLEQRKDVNIFFHDGTDYGYCGFRSLIPYDQLNVRENNSMVLIWGNPDGSRELYYLEKGL